MVPVAQHQRHLVDAAPGGQQAHGDLELRLEAGGVQGAGRTPRRCRNVRHAGRQVGELDVRNATRIAAIGDAGDGDPPQRAHPPSPRPPRSGWRRPRQLPRIPPPGGWLVSAGWLMSASMVTITSPDSAACGTRSPAPRRSPGSARGSRPGAPRTSPASLSSSFGVVSVEPSSTTSSSGPVGQRRCCTVATKSLDDELLVERGHEGSSPAARHGAALPSVDPAELIAVVAAPLDVAQHPDPDQAGSTESGRILAGTPSAIAPDGTSTPPDTTAPAPTRRPGAHDRVVEHDRARADQRSGPRSCSPRGGPGGRSRTPRRPGWGGPASRGAPPRPGWTCGRRS